MQHLPKSWSRDLPSPANEEPCLETLLMEDCIHNPTNGDDAAEKSTTFCILPPKAISKKLPEHLCFLPRHVAGGAVGFPVSRSPAMPWRCEPASKQPRQLLWALISTWASVHFHIDSNTNSADFQVHRIPQLLPLLAILYFCSREAGQHTFFSKLSHGLDHVVFVFVSFEKSYQWSPL